MDKLLAKGAIIIDVRNHGEFAARHHKGSENIPLQQLAKNMDKIKAYKKPIVVCCASGVRSAQAKNMIRIERDREQDKKTNFAHGVKV